MAKLLLLLETEQAPALEALLLERAPLLLGGQSAATLQIMREAADDVFYATTAAYPRPQLIVELVVSPGRPLADFSKAMKECLHGAPFSSSSNVFVMQERIYRQSAPQPVHYHYLMVRKPGFSVADYNDYYSNYHSRFGFHTPAIEGYSQNYIDAHASREWASALAMTTRDVTSISELKMPSMAAFLASPAMAELGIPAAADEERFVDRASSVSFCSDVIFRLGDFDAVGEAFFEQHFC